MKRTITNWKSLGEVLKDDKFKDNPVGIDFFNGELSSITFETKKGYKK